MRDSVTHRVDLRPRRILRCLWRREADVGVQRGSSALTWVLLLLVVLLLQQTLWVQVPVLLVGVLVAILRHRSQLDELHRMTRVLRVLVGFVHSLWIGFPVIRRKLQLHLLLLLLELLHDGLRLVILSYLHRALPLLLLPSWLWLLLLDLLYREPLMSLLRLSVVLSLLQVLHLLR